MALRRRVLRPGRPQAAARLPGDGAAATTTLAATLVGDPGRGPVSTATVRPEPCPWRPDQGEAWRLRAMATDAALAGQGIGALVLTAALAHIGGEGGLLVWCDARVAARPFYERAGFVVEGERFDVDGIGPHWPMARTLP